ncbi:site-specific integrase [Actinocatenispora rupis]|uniref:Tyr recombinase domain-containing protein n=1 Tax=Actinocatenispora rupis TaxID=519421 RepID=A0A8J3NEL5_9ACTN|nr:site-specific integrase [Actinocatenispora rupis]GID14060.1 hypothetical protein Aru02nite_49490 [Actinocatenispora rupis]
MTTVKATAVVLPGLGREETPRPGSRAARLLQPVAKDVARDLAVQFGVCVKPVWLRRTDTTTGETELVSVPCGATSAAKCEPCAEANRRLRMQQIREGWHLTEEPVTEPDAPDEEQRGLVEYRAALEFARTAAVIGSEWDQVTDLDAEIDRVDEEITTAGVRGSVLPGGRKDCPDEESAPSRKRSTKRRQDAPDLPRLPVANRTVPHPHIGSDGREHRESMFLTLTLGSYGAVHSAYWRRGKVQPCECGELHSQHDTRLGTPVDPDAYDYRAAALDAIHFAKVIDRFWQNLRRAVGWKVQYAGSIEMQKRLTPHGHFAVRGALARRLVKQVAAATYHQVWWPAHDELRYDPEGELPTWNVDEMTYRDPHTGEALPTWDEALDAIEDDDDAEPAHVVRLGTVDVKGIRGGSKDAEKTVRYITKYIAKDITDAVTPGSRAQEDHMARLGAELQVLPCSPTCPNWLLRAVLTTAVNEDNILPRNPCRIPGADRENPEERPTLTVTQVYDLAGEMPDRYFALVLLATFASLRYGEVTALQRQDLDLDARTVRVRHTFVERSRGGLLLGPPKSRAGLRTVSIPAAIVSELRRHLAEYAGDEPTAWVFTGERGGPVKRSNFNQLVGWKDAVAKIGKPGLHFHDLRHTGNTLAASSGASTRDLMARMGHDSMNAALIYQHATSEADRAIADALNAKLPSGDDEPDDGAAGVLAPTA